MVLGPVKNANQGVLMSEKNAKGTRVKALYITARPICTLVTLIPGRRGIGAGAACIWPSFSSRLIDCAGIVPSLRSPSVCYRAVQHTSSGRADGHTLVRAAPNS